MYKTISEKIIYVFNFHIFSSVGVTKAEHKLPFFPLIFSDNKEY